MGRLKGKVALISGAARGQGADEARLFAAEGASVVLGDITDDQGQQVAVEIVQSGGNATYVHLDVTREPDWKNAVSMAVNKYSKLDILVNNAGILLLKGLEETETSDWDAIQDVNSRGVFLGAKTVVPAMREAGGGSIVNISSIAGLSGSGSTAYSSSKGLVRILSKSIAVEYGPEKIRCNSVHPGVIDTEMVNGLIGTGGGRQAMIDKTPLGIIANARDVSLGVLYLASDESRYVTGSELVIDGGITVNR
ncbi:MAG: cyclopentanol dehydrogenase [Chloroflexi bacterium]|nr:cyclopentanol dehydrogenase [Chloroflexota bacterium]|tara:strand:+ start:543 stop:1295 length:753 start_codon:yes stop_codon:yes gene_type:complete